MVIICIFVYDFLIVDKLRLFGTAVKVESTDGPITEADQNTEACFLLGLFIKKKKVNFSLSLGFTLV